MAEGGEGPASKRSRMEEVEASQDRNLDYLCPICFDLIAEAHMTRCGHTFCYSCLIQTIEQTSRCPKCNFALDSTDQIFPNFLLNELVSKYRASLGHQLRASAALSHPDLAGLRTALTGRAGEAMSLPDVELMLRLLEGRRQQLAAQSVLSQKQLLREFLQHMKRQKDEQLFSLQKEAAVIEADLEHVEAALRELERGGECGPERGGEGSDASVVPVMESEAGPAARDLGGFNLLADKAALGGEEAGLAARRARMHHHFPDLAACYSSARIDQLCLGPPAEAEGEPAERWGGLEEFGDCLSSLTRYNSIRPLATLAYTTDMFNNSSIVSSIEFDKDQEFFAIAGVTKRIKIYDYNVVLKDMVDIHYPSTEMVCSSKISCISWSSFHKSMLASSDYEGTVIVWDSATNTKSTVWQEHEKRCWSVDFNLVDTKLIASGSDDARVKLWSTNMSHSVASLEAKANVCCVKFNPSSCYHLAFGSADHCVHYYDLRSTKQPLNVFKGHRKAVSYVKFLSSTDIVSASTDSQLKLWNINQPHCARSFTGHVNEKNFVGLATDGDYVTCGSENNGLYVYYKGLSKHLFQFKFDAVRSFLDRDRKEEDVNEFVSAVCWKANSNVMVAANSQGTIKVLELV